jgi:hypothetical protein
VANNIAPDEHLACVIVVGNVAEQQGFRERSVYKIAHRSTKAVEEMYDSKETVPDWFISGMKAVQKAPSAMNKQPVMFSYNNGLVTARVESDSQKIDLGIAKVHFELGAKNGRFELGNDGKYILY